MDYATMLTMLVRTQGAPGDLIPPARERLRGIFPSVPGSFRTMESLLADSYRDRTFVLGILGTFALLSLVLASVGISGVVGYTVSSRAREIGIMLALGAGRWEVRRQMFIRSLYGVLAGIAVGMILAVVAGRVMESLLFQVEPTDAFTLTLAPLVLLVSGGVAILLPVVRYTRIDPAQSMKAE
jgi:putative ABC transport system permease protein